MIAATYDHLYAMQLQIWVLAMHNDLTMELTLRAWLNFELIAGEASEARGQLYAHWDRVQRGVEVAP